MSITTGRTETPKLETNIHSEFGKLRSAIVNRGGSLTDYSTAIEITERLSPEDAKRIAEEERHHPEAGEWKMQPSRTQIGTFINLLRGKGVNLVFADDIKDAFVQFFTRDVGFVIGNRFYIANRTDAYREIEIDGLSTILPHIQKVVRLNEGRIEGGDVIVNGYNVYVGIGERTNEEGFRALRKAAEPDFNVIPVPLRKWVLHLDCRFNILSKNLAVAYPADIEKRALKRLESEFEIIPVTKEEVNRLAPNFFVLDERTIISDNRNASLNDILKVKGFEVYALPYDEVIKIWGSFRCSVLPLYRDE